MWVFIDGAMMNGRFKSHALAIDVIRLSDIPLDIFASVFAEQGAITKAAD
jgi:hypothetical protein